MTTLHRRRLLRGILRGGAVTVALPLLNCFLNNNGTALASGEKLPVRFGTWSWGLGMSEKIFIPKKIGTDFDLPEEMAALLPVKKHINVYTRFNVFRDAAPNLCHKTGWVALKSGSVPMSGADLPGETLDVTVAKKIGRATRFQSLTVNATGNIRDTFSYESKDAINTPELSPINFYQRMFGPDFQDPNAPTFSPSPRVLVRKSVLSAVLDDTATLSKTLGAEDKARIDQYFTGLRELERQLDQQLQKPNPIASCKAPKAPGSEEKPGVDVELVTQRHKHMTDLLVMAIACDQSRVFNMAYSSALALTTKVGYDKPHHTATHEEPIDEHLGYQMNSSWFVRRAMESWSYFVEAFTKINEGDGILLDNVLIYANSDQSLARIHSIDGIPMFTAGRAGGRVKTGLHVSVPGDKATRVGFTAMRSMGVDISSWGTNSNSTDKEISEILS